MQTLHIVFSLAEANPKPEVKLFSTASGLIVGDGVSYSQEGDNVILTSPKLVESDAETLRVAFGVKVVRMYYADFTEVASSSIQTC